MHKCFFKILPFPWEGIYRVFKIIHKYFNNYFEGQSQWFIFVIFESSDELLKFIKPNMNKIEDLGAMCPPF